MRYDWFDYVMGTFIAACLALLIWVLVDYFYAEKLSLVKVDWKCTAERTRLMPQAAGKSIILIPQTYCTQYTQVE